MSREGEKLCRNCGMAIGMPGPPQVKFEKDGKVDAESTFVHDLPGVAELVLTVICPACYTIAHWLTDVGAMKTLVDGCEVVTTTGDKPS